MNAMLDAFNLVGVVYMLCSILLFNKLTDANLLIKVMKKQIQIWIYRSANFNPNQVLEIQKSITQRISEASELRKQLDTNGLA